MPAASPPRPATSASTNPPRSEHARYQQLQLERDTRLDQLRTRLAQEQALAEAERMRCSLRMTVPPSFIIGQFNLGNITPEDYQKYWLSDNAYWVPPIKGIDY